MENPVSSRKKLTSKAENHSENNSLVESKLHRITPVDAEFVERNVSVVRETKVKSKIQKV